MFGETITVSNAVPEDQIRRLRTEGHSLVKIAELTGVTVSVVRRVVGRLDYEAVLRERERVAEEIDRLPIPWPEKVALWRERTGTSEATLWRVLRRLKPSPKHR